MFVFKSKQGYLHTIVEVLAITAPILCLFDCLVLPVVLPLLPLIGIHHFVHGIGDQIITLMVLSIGAPIIVPGFFKHRNIRVLAFFVLAAGIMFFNNIISTQIDELFHISLAVLSSALLIKANLDNRKLLACVCKIHVGHNN
jgi:hypothetical protein